MKALYAIQGTGNGHIIRAKELIPTLRKYIDIDILISGNQCDIETFQNTKYRFSGVSFIFGKNGGINYRETIRQFRSRRVLSEVSQLKIKEYDFVINDFEPISAWAARKSRVHCIGLSHQAAISHYQVPRPKHKAVIGKAILRHYAPANNYLGFHFENYSRGIYTPIIRESIRNGVVSPGDYYTVYLPSYGDNELLSFLHRMSNVQWHVFSKHCQHRIRSRNVIIEPVSEKRFTESMLGSKGVLCGAGFETPSEVLYLGKKLLVVPMRGQYEQQCNAAALHQIGIEVISNLDRNALAAVRKWVDSSRFIQFDYPDIREQIARDVLQIAKFYCGIQLQKELI